MSDVLLKPAENRESTRSAERLGQPSSLPTVSATNNIRIAARLAQSASVPQQMTCGL